VIQVLHQTSTTITQIIKHTSNAIQARFKELVRLNTTAEMLTFPFLKFGSTLQIH